MEDNSQLPLSSSSEYEEEEDTEEEAAAYAEYDYNVRDHNEVMGLLNEDEEDTEFEIVQYKKSGNDIDDPDDEVAKKLKEDHQHAQHRVQFKKTEQQPRLVLTIPLKGFERVTETLKKEVSDFLEKNPSLTFDDFCERLVGGSLQFKPKKLIDAYNEYEGGNCKFVLEKVKGGDQSARRRCLKAFVDEWFCCHRPVPIVDAVPFPIQQDQHVPRSFENDAGRHVDLQGRQHDQHARHPHQSSALAGRASLTSQNRRSTNSVGVPSRYAMPQDLSLESLRIGSNGASIPTSPISLRTSVPVGENTPSRTQARSSSWQYHGSDENRNAFHETPPHLSSPGIANNFRHNASYRTSPSTVPANLSSPGQCYMNNNNDIGTVHQGATHNHFNLTGVSPSMLSEIVNGGVGGSNRGLSGAMIEYDASASHAGYERNGRARYEQEYYAMGGYGRCGPDMSARHAGYERNGRAASEQEAFMDGYGTYDSRGPYVSGRRTGHGRSGHAASEEGGAMNSRDGSGPTRNGGYNERNHHQHRSWY